MDAPSLPLLPHPRRIRSLDGAYAPPVPLRLAWAGAAEPRAPGWAAPFPEDPLAFKLAPAVGAGRTDGLLILDPGIGLAPEHYRLQIAPDGVRAEASDEAGIFYALQTLRQIARSCGSRWPAVRIEDGPDFGERGAMLDISRDKVPTTDTLLEIVDLLAELKFNRLELYTEHTFAYRDHREVWADASPLTGDELRALDAACRLRFIELVPNQNSFGHMERWLRHPRYAPLAECPDGWVPPWSPERRPPSTLDPLNPRSVDLIRGLYNELLPCFASRKFNVGGDEPWELGQGRSRAACESRGRGRVYLDFMLRLRDLVRAHGRVMHFWGDIIHEHADLVPELPRDVVPMEWGYEASHDFPSRTARFAACGLRFLVCPGTSSWNSIAGRSDNAFANLRRAGDAGRTGGAAGYVVTDWGDHGHWQYWPVSFVPLAAAAAHAWNGAAADDDDVVTACGIHVFRDGDGSVAAAARELGNVHLLTGRTVPNSTVLFRLLMPRPEPALLRDTTARGFETVREAVAAAAGRIARGRMARVDADLVRAEFANAARLLDLSARRGTTMLAPPASGHGRLPNAARDCDGIIEEHRRLWLARNRGGGLEDSLARMASLRSGLADSSS